MDKDKENVENQLDKKENTAELVDVKFFISDAKVIDSVVDESGKNKFREMDRKLMVTKVEYYKDGEN